MLKYQSMIEKKNKPLKTSRLSLHQISIDDFNDMEKILNNSELKKTYMIKDFNTIDEAKEYHQKLVNLSLKEDYMFYGIYLDKTLIGFINQVESDESSIEIGYIIETRYHNKGYCSEAVKEVINELFRIGYSKVYCGYFEGNIASEKVMIKCGMKKISKIDTIEYRGKNHKCFYYDIIKKVPIN